MQSLASLSNVPQAAVPPSLEVRDVTKTYGSAVALDDLSFHVNPGEVVGFLGPNGAGKSTASRIIVDLARPSSGTVTVLGLNPRRDGVEVRSRVGYLPAPVGLDPRLTANQLLDHLARLRQLDDPGLRDELIERLALDPTRRIGDLSKGNHQKVGIVQALMHQPELLILDEPTSGLDPVLRQDFSQIIREAAARGSAVLMSSHVLAEVEAAADRVVVINSGRLVAEAAMCDLRAQTVRTIEVEFVEPIDATMFDSIHGLEEVAVDGKQLSGRLHGSPDDLIRALTQHHVHAFTSSAPALEELFFDTYAERARHAA